MRFKLVGVLIMLCLAGCGGAGQGTAPPGRPTEVAEGTTTAGRPSGSDEGTAAPGGLSGSGAGARIAVLTRSGGFAGQHDVLTVQADGRLIVERDGNVATGQAGAAAIQALQDRVNSAEWHALEAKYGEQFPDAFAYTIDAAGKSVTTYDGAQNPEPLATVLDQLLQLLQSVNSTGGSGTS